MYSRDNTAVFSKFGGTTDSLQAIYPIDKQAVKASISVHERALQPESEMVR
jgi:hypothetical protein